MSIDLHTHSTASDGTMSPTQLVHFAKENGITAIALTDHDTVSGISEFKKACQDTDMIGISGVEISAKYKCEMHILGLFIDENDKQLNESLKSLKHSRFERNKKCLKLLQENGFNITDNDITVQKDNATLENTGRAHFSHILMKKGYTNSVQEGFDKYLGKGKPCYVARQTFSPRESIDIIKNSGGVAILAHPIYITKDKDELRTLLIELKEYGLDGIECWHSQYNIEYMNLCLELCKELSLIPTGGSDFHADNKPNVEIGKVCGSLTVPFSVLSNLMSEKL